MDNAIQVTNAAPAAGGATAPAVAPAPTVPQPGPEGTPAPAQTGGDQKPDKQDRFEAAQQMIGKQGKEIGDLRQSNRELQTQLQQLVKMQQEFIQSQQPAAPDITATINDKLASGEISVAQALKMQADYLNDSLSKTAQQQVNNALRIEKWKSAHPDFDQMMSSGEIQQYAQSHPNELFNDEIDVYRAIVADRASGKAAELEANIPNLVTQAAQKAAAEAVANLQKIAQGAEATATVMPNTGAGVREQNQKPLTGNDFKAGLYAVARKAAGQG